VNRTTAVRLGIPVRSLTLRIVLPLGALLLIAAFLLSFRQLNRLENASKMEQQATVRTVFETSLAVNSGRNGFSVLSQNRGYERVWVLSATGDILESNQEHDVGQRLDDRWWRLLEGRPPGLIQEQVQFGSQQLSMTAIHNLELGRWVVIISRPSSAMGQAFIYFAIILGLSLILWILVSLLISATLTRKISAPIKKLDDRTHQLVKGRALSEAALERLWAETAPALGGHADCVVDLARRLQENERRLVESRARFRSVFDSIHAFAFIRAGDARIVDCNQALSEELDLDRRWISGRDVTLFNDVLPITALERWFSKAASSKVGVRRMELYPDEKTHLERPLAITICPILHHDSPAHLVIAELLDQRESIVEQGFDGEVDASRSDSADSKTSDSLISGDGAVLDIEEPTAHRKTSINDELLNGIMEATGQFVVAFNEEAETIFFSPAASLITGFLKRDVDDLKTFTEALFSNPDERLLFRSWLDGNPEDRSQELNINTKVGTVSSRWYASELDIDGHGSVGVLWASLDSTVMRKSPETGEPAP